MIHHPVAIRIAIDDRTNLGGVPFDHQPIALGPAEVLHHIVTENIDPVVVQIGIFTRNAMPVDAAIVAGVLLNKALLGVDQRLEVEDIGAAAANQ